MKKLAAAICFMLVSACGLNVEESTSEKTSTAAEEDNEEERAVEKKNSNTAEETSEETEADDEQENRDNIQKKKNDPLYKVNPADSSLDPLKEKADPKKVLITIDDAPDTYSVKMAETLAEKNVPAVFFVNGHFLEDEEGKEKLKKIDGMGFEIGNHTMTHADVSELSAEELETEIGALNDRIEDIIGEEPDFFRAPFGMNSDQSKAYIEDQGMTWMNWTYGYDWESEYQNPEALTDIMLDTKLLRDGANLLMHDRKWTHQALDGIIDGFRDKGYGFIDPANIKKNE
ncbi:polysaccharide deacetylase family protein [Salibacterium sp. K-3]